MTQPSKRSPIRAVLFDMDGLMLDTEPIYRRMAQRAARDLGFELSDAAYTCMVGRATAEAGEALAAVMGPGFPLDRFWDRCRYHGPICFEETPAQLKPGLIDLLDWLDHHSIPKAIATSTKRTTALRHLDHAGLLARFAGGEAVATRDQVERGKPAPDLFLYAASLINAGPASCVVLEDSEAGVLGAHAAGMVAVMVPDLIAPTDPARACARHICPSLADAHRLLRELLSGP